MSDLRYTVRRLTRTPLVSLLAILTLAAGIGATTAVFTLVDRVLLRPLPFKDPDRLVVLWERNAQLGRDRDQASAANFVEWQAGSRALEALAAFYQYEAVTVTGTAEPLQPSTARMTPNTFSLLGVEPMLGRGFLTSEGAPQGDRVIVLSHALWQRAFAGDRSVVGKTITVDGAPHQVVGVMPGHFQFPDADTEMWIPLVFDGEALQERSRRSLNVIGRLREGTSIEAAQGELNVVAGRLAQAHPQSNMGWSVSVVSAREQLVEDVRPALLAMLGAVVLVLVLASANLAGLLLVRTYAREREFAIRAALGAGWRRIARQALMESMVLAVAGGAAGTAMAVVLVRLLVHAAGDYLPFANLAVVDARVVAFAAGVSLLVGFFLGLAPTVRSARVRQSALRTVSTTGSPRSALVQNSLVVGEIALALVLTVGAGLLVQTFIRLYRVDPGFDPERVLVARVSLPPTEYAEDHEQLAFFEQVLERLRQAPDVVGAGAVSALPMSPVGIDFDLPVQVAGDPEAREGEEPQADFRVASPGYFEVMRMRLLRGRTFGEQDRDGAPRVMVVNQTMARQFWGARDPVGRQVSIPMGGPHEVVGVVGDVKHRGLDQAPRPEMYVPLQQTSFNAMTLVVRTRRSPEGFMPALTEQVRAVDPSQPVSDMATLESVIAGSTNEARLSSVMATVLATAALLLAAIGIYGVISYSVATRTREFGLRMALGAAPRRIAALVFTRGLRITGVGLAIGLLLTYWAVRAISGLLFGIAPFDVATFGGVVFLVLVVTLLASVVPGFRAMRIEPTDAIRQE